MQYRILGSLDVLADDRPVELPVGQVRALLALLLINRERALDVDSIVDALWGESLPRNPRASLHTLVARLRKSLSAAGADDRIVTVDQRYRLRLDEDQLDADMFEDLVARGHFALSRGDAAAAATRLREALRLWRGPALAGLDGRDFARAEILRLNEARLIATEDRIDAELRLGRHQEVAAELRTLALAHPLRERMWRLFLLALYRNGQQAEALNRASEFTERLSDELAILPSERFRELEHMILDQDTRLESLAENRDRSDGGASAATLSAIDMPVKLGAARAIALVGRRDEVARLVAADRAHHLSVVVGEPGIGKTRLVAEAAAELHGSGATVLYGACDRDPQLAYRPIVQIVNQVLDSLGRTAIDSLGAMAGELGRIVPDLALRFESVPQPTDAAPSSVPYLVARSVDALLRPLAAEGPLVVVIDDLHWADAPTLGLLEALLTDEASTPLALIATRRSGSDDHLRHLLVAAARSGRLDEIELGGLSVDEVTALVNQELETKAIPWLGRSVFDHSGGNPFFALELARHLAGRGAAEVSDRLPLPTTVAAVVDQRVADLGSHVGATLAVAALIGDEFDVDLVVAAGDASHDREALTTALRAGLLVDADEPGRLAFAHGIVRSAISRAIPPGERARIHASIAQALEGRGSVEVPHATLAWHWSRAGAAHVDRTVESCLAAADEAMRRRAYEDAAARCLVGLDAMAAAQVSDVRTSRLLIVACEALTRSAEYTRARELGLRAVDIARQLDDGEALARAALAVVPPIPDGTLAPLLEEAFDRCDDPTVRTRLLASLGFVLGESDPQRAERAIAEARSQALVTGDLDALHMILAFDYHAGDDVDPAALIDTATRIIESSPRYPASESLLDAFSRRGAARMVLGDMAGAREDFETHEQLASLLRLSGSLAVDAQRQAMWALLDGRFAEAEARVHEAMMHVSNDPAWVGVYGAQLIAIRHEQGRWEEILALLDAALAEEIERPVQRATRAMALAEIGECDVCSDLVADLLDELCGGRRDMFWSVAVSSVVDASVASNDKEAARAGYALLKPYEDRLVVFAYGAVCWGSVHRFLAPAALTFGDLDASITHFEKAIDIHARVGARTFLARDRLGLSRALALRGSPDDLCRAAALSDEAHDALREMGMPVPRWAITYDGYGRAGSGGAR